MGFGRCVVVCVFGVAIVGAGTVAGSRAQGRGGLVAEDLLRLRSVAQAEFSPDGKLIAYTVIRHDRPGRPWPQLWVMDAASGKSVRIGGEQDVAGAPVWSPDGKWIAFNGVAEGKHGLAMAHPDGSAVTFLAEASGSNAPLPGAGAEFTWSPDSKQIAYISATPCGLRMRRSGPNAAGQLATHEQICRNASLPVGKTLDKDCCPSAAGDRSQTLLFREGLGR